MSPVIKKPLAWIPVALPILMLVMLGHALATHGVTRTSDEGTEAHLFQLWIVLETILIICFAATWVPKAPKQAGLIIALQLVLSFIPLALVHRLNL